MRTGKQKPKQKSSKLQSELQKTKKKLAEVQSRLFEAQAAFEAIQKGEIDALVIGGAQDPQVYTLKGADHTYRLFLENMNEGARTVNAEGIILFANNHFSKMIQTPLQDIVGSSLYSFVRDLEHSILKKVLVPSNEEHIFQKIYLKIPDESTISTFFNLNRFAVSGTDVICIIVTDLREREHLEAERHLRKGLEESELRYRDLTSDLEERVQNRTRELRVINEELLRSNKELESFAYVASHDLQEPLRMITSYVQLIQLSYEDKRLQEDLGEYVEHMVDAAERMRTLINDLLDYSRIRSSPLKRELVSLEKPLKRAMKNIQAVIQDSQAEVIYDSLPVVFVDELQLTRVFQNLLHNAIKFKGAHTPRINISAKQEDSVWVISVKDNGIGIDADFHGKIFEIFQRLHDRESYSGTGMGLAICKLAVERHGGEIGVQSKIGNGSTFYFTLPLVEPPVA
jgi:signal transduction histidine kinase